MPTFEVLKTPASFDFDIVGTEQAGAQIIVENEMISYFNVTGSFIPVLDYSLDNGVTWIVGTLATQSNPSHLTGKTKDVDILWDAATDLDATSSYIDTIIRERYYDSTTRPYCYNFAGSNIATMITQSIIYNQPEWTFMAWVKPNTTIVARSAYGSSEYGQLYGDENADVAGFGEWTPTGGTTRKFFYIQTNSATGSNTIDWNSSIRLKQPPPAGGGDKEPSAVSEPASSSQWHLLTCVWDSASETPTFGRYRFYLNKQYTEAPLPAIEPIGIQNYVTNYAATDAKFFRLGGWSDSVLGQQREYLGDVRIADVKMWNRALSHADVNFWNDNPWRFATGSQADNLVAHWTFQEGSGSIIHSVTGSGTSSEWQMKLKYSQSYDNWVQDSPLSWTDAIPGTFYKTASIDVIDFRPSTIIPVLKPFYADDDFVVEFYTPICVKKIRTHFTIEVSNTSSFGEINYLYTTENSQSGFTVSGSAFPASGSITATSDTDKLIVQFDSAVLRALNPDEYFVRISRSLYEL